MKPETGEGAAMGAICKFNMHKTLLAAPGTEEAESKSLGTISAASYSTVQL